MPWTILLFILFGGLAVGCALAVVAQRNPLYSAVSLIGVFISLACLYVTLAAPFIAAVQVIVYAGAIMVLVTFVIMLLNVEEEVSRPVRLRYLIPVAVGLAAVLIAETVFMLALRGPARAGDVFPPAVQDAGTTLSIGRGLFTEYLLPFEVTSILILMAMVGAITLARRAESPAVEGGAAFSGPPMPSARAARPEGEGAVQPGFTEATGQAFARYQIEKSEEEGHTPERRQEEKE
jgi:NADH-quinone oxidoreductase subunit J